MNVRALICFSMLFIFNSSQSMELIKKIKKLKHTNDKSTNIITKEFFTTHRLFAETTLRDIVNLIRQYSILLRNKDLETNKTFVEKWDDFGIPRKYYPLLTTKQIPVLEKLLISNPFKVSGRRHLPEIYYTLHSDKQYNQFITIPIELRKCLALLPKSVLQEQLSDTPYSPVPINKNATIEVSTTASHIIYTQGDFYGSIPKPIIPENSKNKK